MIKIKDLMLVNSIYMLTFMLLALGFGGIAGAEESQAKGSTEITLPGKYLDAWNACYPDFRSISDLSLEEKNLSHYEILFSEEDECITIWLVPKLIYRKPPKESTMKDVWMIGRETRYILKEEKGKYIISERSFYKF